MKAIDQCKTLQDFKDLVAIRKQWIDFKDFYDGMKTFRDSERFIMEMTDIAAELYAKYKSKESTKLLKSEFNLLKKENNRLSLENVKLKSVQKYAT